MERGSGASVRGEARRRKVGTVEDGRGGGGHAAGGDRPRLASPCGSRRPTFLPVLGALLLVAIWIYGGRAGWASGMFVTPPRRSTILGDSRDVYFPLSTAWSAFRGLLIGVAGVHRRAHRRWGAVPAPEHHQAGRHRQRRPVGRGGPCLIIILGKSLGPTAVAALAVFFYVFISTTVGLSAAPAAVHDVASVLGASRFPAHVARAAHPAWPSIADGLLAAPRHWPAPSSASGTEPRGLGVLLITAMQSARPQQLWAASLLGATIGLLARALLAGSRMALTRRFGSTIAESSTVKPRATGAAVIIAEVIAFAALAVVLVTIWWAWIELADVAGIVVPPVLRLGGHLVGAGEYVSATVSTLYTRRSRSSSAPSWGSAPRSSRRGGWPA